MVKYVKSMMMWHYKKLFEILKVEWRVVAAGLVATMVIRHPLRKVPHRPHLATEHGGAGKQQKLLSCRLSLGLLNLAILDGEQHQSRFRTRLWIKSMSQIKSRLVLSRTVLAKKIPTPPVHQLRASWAKGKATRVLDQSHLPVQHWGAGNQQELLSCGLSPILLHLAILDGEQGRLRPT